MSTLFYIASPILLLAGLRFMIVALNYTTRPTLPKGDVQGNPLVSVLIPARDEEENIGNILNGILQQSYQNIEVIVYNDQSTDETALKVLKFISADKRVHLVQGAEKPEGWLGKNFACHQLALHAKGEFFIYLDADVAISPNLIHNGLAYIQRKKLALLSMFPRQELKSFGELLVVPSMNWILLSMLCLRLVRWSKRRSLSAANGQFMMFERKLYLSNMWHQQVKDRPAEDIAISRLVKRYRLPMATLLGTNDISCRMYGSYAEAINGFTKNVKDFFGGSIAALVVFALFETIGPVIVILGMPFPLALLFFTFSIASRILVSKLSEQSAFSNVILWPLQQAAFLHLVAKAIQYSRSKNLIWKGRKV